MHRCSTVAFFRDVFFFFTLVQPVRVQFNARPGALRLNNSTFFFFSSIRSKLLRYKFLTNSNDVGFTKIFELCNIDCLLNWNNMKRKFIA